MTYRDGEQRARPASARGVGVGPRSVRDGLIAHGAAARDIGLVDGPRGQRVVDVRAWDTDAPIEDGLHARGARLAAPCALQPLERVEGALQAAIGHIREEAHGARGALFGGGGLEHIARVAGTADKASWGQKELRRARHALIRHRLGSAPALDAALP